MQEADPPIISLQGAALFAKGYIELCCDPAALEISPLCKGIGGHIRIAEVTPTIPLAHGAKV